MTDLWLLELLRLTIFIGYVGVGLIVLALSARTVIFFYDKIRDWIEDRGRWPI